MTLGKTPLLVLALLLGSLFTAPAFADGPTKPRGRHGKKPAAGAPHHRKHGHKHKGRGHDKRGSQPGARG